MNLIKHYFKDLSEEQIELLKKLTGLIVDWNSKINLISKNDISKIEERHILHSLSIAKFISFKTDTIVADVGTGGGFPGLPLAIMFPKTDFFLIDSIRKKINVVQNISETLSLKNVHPVCSRIEDINQKFEFIVSRAVTSFPEFVKLIKNKTSYNHKNEIKNGIICLKGGELDNELTGFNDAMIIPISKYFKEEFFKTKKVIYYPY